MQRAGNLGGHRNAATRQREHHGIDQLQRNKFVRQQAARLASIRKYIDHVAATYRGPRLHILNGWSIAALIDVKPTADATRPTALADSIGLRVRDTGSALDTRATRGRRFTAQPVPAAAA